MPFKIDEDQKWAHRTPLSYEESLDSFRRPRFPIFDLADLESECRKVNWTVLLAFLSGLADRTRDLLNRQQAASAPAQEDVQALLTPNPLNLDEMLPDTCFPIDITGVSLERVVPPKARGSRGSSSRPTPSQADNSEGDATGSDNGPGSPRSLPTGTSAASETANRPTKRKLSNLNAFSNLKRQKAADASLHLESDIDIDADADADIRRWRQEIGG